MEQVSYIIIETKEYACIGYYGFLSFLLCIGYSTTETKEAARIGYHGFLFQHGRPRYVAPRQLPEYE
jgi:hypothetical protein